MSKLSLNIGLLGSSGAGKTSIINRFTNGTFESTILSTISIDKIKKQITIDDEIVQLVLVDTLGQERYGEIVSSFFRRLNGIIFVYAINSEASFTVVKEWLEKAKENTNQYVSFILLGNKKDLERNEINDNILKTEKDYRVISEEQGMKLAEEMKCPFYEVSAKENINVNEAIMDLVKNLYNIKKNMKSNENTLTLRKKAKKQNCDC